MTGYKKCVAIILALSMVFATFMPIAYASESTEGKMGIETIEPDQDLISSLKLNKSMAVSGTQVSGRFDDDDRYEAAVLGYVTPSGERVEVEMERDSDSGYYYSHLVPEQTGFWTLAYLKLTEGGSDTYFSGSSFYASFKVVGSLHEVFGKDGPIIDGSGLEDGATIRKCDLTNALAQIRAYDSVGDSIPVDVEVIGQENNLFFQMYNDGLTITAITAPSDEVQTGNYTANFSSEGGAVSKNFTVVDDTAEASYVHLSSLPEVVESEPIELSTSSINLSGTGTTTRLWGQNRFDTAVSLSSDTFDKADRAVLVNAFNFPDALAAVSLASTVKGPILFTEVNDTPAQVMGELKRLGVKNIYVIGGINMVSNEVVAKLGAAGIKTSRISGSSRFLTAIEISKELNSIKKFDKAILVYAYNFPDALSAGAYSGKMGYPVFYTEPDAVGDLSLATIKGLGVKEVIIVGGQKSISANIETQLKNSGIIATRVSGANRYETSYNFAKKYYPNTSTITVANGENFPDALAGGPVAAANSAPILLSPSTSLYTGIQQILNEGTALKALIFGGKGSVSDSIVDNVQKIVLSNFTKAQALAAASKPDTSVPSVPTGQTKPSDTTTPSKTPDKKPQPPKTPVKNIAPRVPTADKPIRIMLDPGHGWGYNKGVIEGYFEGNAMYWYAYILKNELEKYGFEVGVTRWDIEAEEAYVKGSKLVSTNGISLQERGSMGEGYDLLLSLHTNALSWTTPNYDKARGTEIFDSVTQPRKDLAEKLCSTIVDHFEHNNRGVKYKYDEDDGLNWYGVLRYSKATHSMLVEHGFHTNKEDCTLLMDKNFKIEMAQKTAKTLAEYYGMPVE